MSNPMGEAAAAAVIIAFFIYLSTFVAAPTVKRWHDDERKVTCWTVPGGISCLPDAQVAAPDAGPMGDR